MPYLALMDRLRSLLKRPAARLVVSGYSFNDEHINEVLAQSLRTNPTATVHGLLFGELSSYERACSLASKQQNLLLLAADGAVIGKRRAAWAVKEVRDPTTGAVVATTPESKRFAYGDFAKFGEFLARLTPSNAEGDTRAA
jgi:hypothetical protein